MAEILERRRRRTGNGELRSRAGHVREDVGALREDLTKLRSDLGALVALQWGAAAGRMSDGVDYVQGRVREHPLASVGAAVGAGLLAGLAVAAMNGRGHDARR